MHPHDHRRRYGNMDRCCKPNLVLSDDLTSLPWTSTLRAPGAGANVRVELNPWAYPAGWADRAVHQPRDPVPHFGAHGNNPRSQDAHVRYRSSPTYGT